MGEPSPEIVKIEGGKGLFDIMPNPYTPQDAGEINFPKLEVRGVEIEGKGAAFVRDHVSVVRDSERGIYVIVGEKGDRELVKKILAVMSQKGESESELAVRLKKAKSVKTIDVIFIPHSKGVVEGDLQPTLIYKGAPDFIMTARNGDERTVLTTKGHREQQRLYMKEGVNREKIEDLNEVTSDSGPDAVKVDVLFAASDRPFLTVKKV